MEIAQITIREGLEPEFESKFKDIVAFYREAVGWQRAWLHRSIEDPRRYLLFVEWATMENHVKDFRESENFTKFRELVGPLFDGPTDIGHSELVAES